MPTSAMRLKQGLSHCRDLSQEFGERGDDAAIGVFGADCSCGARWQQAVPGNRAAAI